MNLGNSLPDADLSCRPGQDDAGGPGAAHGPGDGQPGRSLRAQRPLQDIQDIIDKLAAVTQQLRHPRSSMPGSPRQLELIWPAGPLRGDASEQAGAVGGAERSRAQQREGVDVAGDVGLAVEVNATG